MKMAINDRAADIETTLNVTMLATKQKSSKEFLANSFLIGMDKATHGGITEKTSDNHLFGDRKCPKALNEDHKHANDFK